MGTRLREGLEVLAITQDALAAHLDCDPRTVRNMLAGRSLSIPRLKSACEFLGIAFTEIERIAEAHGAGEANVAAQNFGGYSRGSVERMMKPYVAVRHSFGNAPTLHVFRIILEWDDEKQAMRFRDNNRFLGSDGEERDYSQSGYVHISPDIGLLHLVTQYVGAVRLITLSKPRLSSGILYGTLLTQADHAVGFQPAVSPVVFVPEDTLTPGKNLPEHVGPIAADHFSFGYWNSHLATARAEFALICDAPTSL